MTDHSFLLRCDEPLALRDGRPWGAGQPSASRSWPLPQTLAGMVRSKIGLNRAADFFRDPQRAQSLLTAVRLGLSLPAVRAEGTRDWSLLFPTPADAIGFPAGKDIEIKTPALTPIGSDWCDLDDSAHWLAPILDDPRKPDRRAPAWWHGLVFLDWLAGKLPTTAEPSTLGPPPPERRWRTHTAIDPETGSAMDRQLFSSEELILRSATHEWALALSASVEQSSDLPSLNGAFHLGGDRRTALAETFPTDWPAFPVPTFAQPAKWLKLYLLTPGDFGGWHPQWLKPNAWGEVPGCPATRVRLGGATISHPQSVSGWDFQMRRPSGERGGPKATRFLVPAGSLYVIELEKPEAAPALARHLWLRSLTDDANGHAFAVPGLLHHPIHSPTL